MSKFDRHARSARAPSYSCFRKTPVALAISLALFGSQVVLAEEKAKTKAEESAELGEVTVTGSRIKQITGMSTPTPVAALSTADLQAMAPGSLTQALTQLPQFYGSATAENFGSVSNGFFASPGGGSLNLRGVGSKRTLTLLDGRRVVPASLFGGPDINMFPKEMLKQVDTVTGGASAAYGTDAVSGVVNYILDTNFTGIKGHVQGGETSRGDGQNSEIGLAMGHRFDNGLHVLASIEHANQESIETYAGRNWYNSSGLIRNPNADSKPAVGATPAINTTSASNPLWILSRDIRSMNASYDGVITAWQALPTFTVPASFTRSIFNSDGSVSPFVNGAYANPAAGVGSQSVTGNAGSGTDNAYERPNLLPRDVRSDAFLYVDKDVTDNLNVYAQGMYGKQSLRATNVGGLFHSGNNQPITIFSGNPFLPANLQAQMTAGNVASFTLGRIGDAADLAANAYTTQNTTVKSGTVGFKSTIKSDGFFNDWSVDGYAQYGKTDIDARQEGGIRLDRIFLALDAVKDPATGRTVCNVTLVSGRFPDCVPLNLFGRGNASQQAINWVTGFEPGASITTVPYYPPPTVADPYSYISDTDKHRVTSMNQRVFELSSSGKIYDGWAGPVTMALGVHYRKEEMVQDIQAPQGNPSASPNVYPVLCNDNAAATTAVACVSQVAQGLRPTTAIGVRGVPGGAQNNTVELQFSKVPFANGAYAVKEGFVEFNVPLLSGMPMLKDLTLNTAARFANYGGSGSIWSYKAGLNATLNDELRLRGTYSRDVRAANFDERFDRTGGLAGQIFDYTGTVKNTTAVTPAPFLVTGGNPDVSPEKADTFTAGVVYRPQWLDGFDMSVDYLTVSIKDAIGQYGQQETIDGCFLRGDQNLCAGIIRDPANNIIILNTTFQNINQQKISAVDLEFGYNKAIDLFGGGERIGARVFATYLGEQSFTGTSGIKADSAGNVAAGLPDWKAVASLTYSRGPLHGYLQARYVSGGRLSDTFNTTSNAGATVYDVANNHIGSVTYFDTRVSYELSAGDGTLEIFANVNNLLDRDPPVIPVQFGGLGSAAGQYSQTNYDVLGRRFTVGVNLKF